MTRSILDGAPWAEVVAAGIRTTADGPFAEDVFWLLFRTRAFRARYEEQARAHVRSLLDGPRYRRYLRRRWWRWRCRG